MAAVAAANDLLTSPARVKERLELSGSAFDSLLTSIIAEVSHEIQKRAGRLIGEQAHTEYHNGTGSSYLTLRQGPLVTVTSVESIAYSEGIAGARTTTGTALDPYQWLEYGTKTSKSDGPARLYLPGSTFTAGELNWRVVYTAGYDYIPETLVGRVNSLVGLVFTARRSPGLRTRTDGESTLDYNAPAEIDRTYDRIADEWRYDWGLRSLSR